MSNSADQKLMRIINKEVVIDVIRKEAPLSRANLSAITELNRSTISSIINDLIDEGWVKETTYQTNNIGRPGLQLEINPAGGFAIGVEMGVDFILVIAVNFSAEVIWRKRIETDPNEGQVGIQGKAFNIVREAIEFSNKKYSRQLGIGIAIPGLVDVNDGILKLAPNLQWKDVPLRLIWTQQFQTPVFIENDANAAALGEYYFGAAQEIKNFIYIAAGFGLGSGIIIDGQLLRGNKGFAAAVGHTTIDPRGEFCSCGKRGCYETVIGPRAVIKNVKKIIAEEGEDSTIIKISKNTSNSFGYNKIVDAAKKNDKVALNALEDVGKHLGLVVSNLVNTFNPKMVILGGALNYAKDFIQPVVIEIVKQNALSLCQEDLEITNSKLDKDSSVMGVAGLLLKRTWNG